MMNIIKEHLYTLCKQYATERVNTAQQGINEARASSAGETKSSAGDKYETGRAMAQQEIDRNTALLAEGRQLLHAVDKIKLSANSHIVIPGSLVITDKANFYVSISAGAFIIENEKYFAISPSSPIGLKLMGKKPGDIFEMNGLKYTVSEVC